MVVLAFLIWRSFNVGGISWPQTIFWAIFPDLLAFIPIGLSSRRREWPSWGATLYNVSHTLLVWGPVMASLWFAYGAVYWPLTGWLVHITADRAMGYGLRVKFSRS